MKGCQSIKECQEHLANLYNRQKMLEKEDDSQILPGSERDNIINDINKFIEENYAKEVFDYYKNIKPRLIRLRTGEEYGWEEAFGETFEDVSKSLRHSLVGLIEGGGRYRFKKPL